MRFGSETVRDDRNRPVEVDCLGAAVVGYPVALTVIMIAGCLVSAVFPHVVIVGVTLVAFVLWFTSPVMLAAWRSGTAPRQVSRALLQNKCPACHYQLSGAQEQPDGCTICPECGAAWRLNRSVD